MNHLIKKKYIHNYQYVCSAVHFGKALIIATDTVFGLVAKNPETIYSIKKRSLKKN